MALPAADIAVMRHKAQFNAKVPQLHFESDSRAKRNRASAHAPHWRNAGWRPLTSAWSRPEQSRITVPPTRLPQVRESLRASRPE